MRVIDVRHMGRERVIGCFEHEGVLVDPGPESTVETLLEGLGEGFEPRALLLTHIHFDHAGSSGALVRRWPQLPVYVHAVGAPHMADPERLVRSATRLYGEDGMPELWGEGVPGGGTHPPRRDGGRSSRCRKPTCPWSRAAKASSATTASSTRPATPRTTSPTCTSRPGRRSWG